MPVAVREGGGGGTMTFLVLVDDEHGASGSSGFTDPTVAGLRASGLVLVDDEQGGGGGGSGVAGRGAGGGGGSQVSGSPFALLAVFAWVSSNLALWIREGSPRLADFEIGSSSCAR